MKKTILLTGGAGYIGSHTAFLLHTLGYEVVVIDSLLHGQLFPFTWATLIKTDISNRIALTKIFEQYSITAVMHFAGFIEVGESVKRPHTFYHNNVTNTLNLLDVMRQFDVNHFIFSSTCALYGNPIRVPMDEEHPFAPVSPYGKTKLVVEYALQDYAQAYGLKYVALRYFNAAGALPEQGLGEIHHPETHVIPLLLRAAAANNPFSIFGNDYATPDGTCIRDYIHVLDIAQAHVLALDFLEENKKSDVFNLGTGHGYSVKQLVDVAQQVIGKPINTIVRSRRAGDAEVLIADPRKAQNVLGWKPECSDLHTIISSAWQWECKPQTLPFLQLPLS